MPEINLIPLTALDESFLWEMLYLPCMFRKASRLPREILNDPDIACYVKGWGRSGDWGCWRRMGTPVGALWLRQWSGDEKGYGYVSPQIPELSIALMPAIVSWDLERMLNSAISMACRATLLVFECC